MKPLFGWVWEPHSCDEDTGWLLRRADRWEQDQVRLRRLRRLHPRRARQWRSYGTAIRRAHPLHYRESFWMGWLVDAIFDNIFAVKPIRFAELSLPPRPIPMFATTTISATEEGDTCL